MNDTSQYQAGVKVTVTKGIFKDRTGVVKRRGTAFVFPDRCAVILDLKKREKIPKSIFIEYTSLEIIKD